MPVRLLPRISVFVYHSVSSCTRTLCFIIVFQIVHTDDLSVVVCPLGCCLVAADEGIIVLQIVHTIPAAAFFAASRHSTSWVFGITTRTVCNRIWVPFPIALPPCVCSSTYWSESLSCVCTILFQVAHAHFVLS